MLHKHGPVKKFFNEYYEISVFKQPYLKSGTLAKKSPYMTKPVWSHVLASSAIPTIPDCIRYIIGVFCYNFKSQTNILLSYYHTSLCQS